MERMLRFYFNFTAILFEDAIILGAENDTLLYSSDSNSVFSLPFCVLNRTVSFILFIHFNSECVFYYGNVWILESSIFASNFTSAVETKFRISRVGNRS